MKTQANSPSKLRNSFGQACFVAILLSVALSSNLGAQEADDEVVRVFIFAGQSNMVGSDSKVQDIERFPPYRGLEDAQSDVKFSYCIGRENKKRSNGWVPLQAVDNVVGPELSFARQVTGAIDSPIAIIKCAAGGTHLGGDWNPDEPSGFEMYPLLLDLVRESLAELENQGLEYRLEGMMWHQGENDMFNEDYMANYGTNLANFMKCVRRDLETPDLKFYVGELCTKTIWGMDLRPRMYAISLGQKEVTGNDELAEYVPTSHVGVEIGGGVGLHYHYGTLGQLQHGSNYATAYLRTIGELEESRRPLETWPYEKGERVKLFILAGHRNMEGERAFVQELEEMNEAKDLSASKPEIAFKYNLGGGYQTSDGWEPFGLVDYYDTFGPELSFAERVSSQVDAPIAIAKFTHSGSQIIDWTPEGSEAKTRNLYATFIDFAKESIEELEAKGVDVEVVGIFYHIGENDMSFFPYRKDAAKRIESMIASSREDLESPNLTWYLSQQPPTDHENVNRVDVVADIEQLAGVDDNIVHIKAFELPEQEKQLVIDTKGIIALGYLIANEYLRSRTNE